MLAKGGNAVDAAVAAAFVQGVVNPLLCGIGGHGILLIHHGPSGRVHVIDSTCAIGSRPTPADWAEQFQGRSEAVGRYILGNEENQMGYRSILLPSFIKGASEAFRRFGSGRISWEEVLEPAKRLALEGFEVYPYIAGFRRFDEGAGKPGYPSFERKLTTSPAAQVIYGEPLEVGQRFVQTDYGQTLSRLARDGGEDFYRGGIAGAISSDMERQGGLITAEDLAEYSAFEGATLTGHYRGYEIRACISGSSNSPQLVSMLQILDGFDLSKIGWNTPAYVDLVARAMRASFVDHQNLKGDPPYSVKMGLLQKFTSVERARYWQERIASERISGTQGASGLGSETTHVSVVDGEGTAVSWTHSIGSMGGSGVVTPGLGFLYNNFMGHFHPMPGHWNSILPGKRSGGGAPLLLYQGGKLALVIGAPGGSRIMTAILQTLLNVIDHGMSIQEAVSAPRFHSEEERLIFLEPEVPEATAEALSSSGYQVRRSRYQARVQAIKIDTETGTPSAGADPRGGGGQAVIA